MTTEEKYKLLLFQTIRADILPSYAQVMEIEKAKKLANQTAIATISQFPELIDFEKLKPDYDEALAEVKKEYIKEGKVFIELPEPTRRPDFIEKLQKKAEEQAEKTGRPKPTIAVAGHGRKGGLIK